jgi:hypothetical protein
MKPAAGRLLLMIVLFGGWLAYLGYLVYTRPQTVGGKPLVLSRPQFLVSTLDVIGRVEDHDKVTVVEVLYPAQGAPVKKGDVLSVEDFGSQPPPSGYSGPGEYLLPLLPLGPDKKRFRVTPIPPSPGYARGEARIYPVTAQTLAQYREMPKPGGG